MFTRFLALAAAWVPGVLAAQRSACPPNADCIRPFPIRPPAAHIARTASDVRITLDGRVLRYEINETFVNRGGAVGEADYLLPLPRNAAFEDLALEINGELVNGETLPADRARGIYEEIVRRSRDPGLVEWMGQGLLRTRIFPIAAGETKRVVIRFRAVAPREGNALRIDYLSGGTTPGSVESSAPTSLSLLIPRGDAYGTPYSPTHQLDVVEGSSALRAREIRVRGDASRLTALVPVREGASAAITSVAYAPAGEDGFALITLSPPPQRAARVPRDVTFIVDISGSMSGGKIEQARAAGRTLLGTLSPADRFRLISFSSDVDEFRDGWATATDDNLRAGRAWVNDLRAAGSTNIEAALDRALTTDTRNGRLGLVLLLTDGAATVGERDPQRLAEMAARRRAGQRIFTFGLGADVQAAMLERMAIEGRGTAHFVQPSEDVEHAVGVVAQQLTAPVATGVTLQAQGVTLRQMQPEGPQDVFAGQDLTYVVRYRGSGAATLTFRGDGGAEWTERVTLPERSHDNAFVAKLWAVQRVGWLSAERRRQGPNRELDNELRELGMKYGIPTELSSYLVLEPGMPANQPLAAGAGGGLGGRAGDAQHEFVAARAAAAQRAVKSLADAASIAPSPVTQNAGARDRRDVDALARQVGDRTFVQRGGQWVDTRFRDDMRRVTIKPFSAAYFALVQKVPALAAAFALGDSVSVGGRNVALVLAANGTEQLSAAELDGIVRDW